MDNQLLGALLGLALAIVDFLLFGMIIRKQEEKAGNRNVRERHRSLVILDLVRKANFVLLPVILYVAFGFIEGQIIG